VFAEVSLAAAVGLKVLAGHVSPSKHGPGGQERSGVVSRHRDNGAPRTRCPSPSPDAGSSSAVASQSESCRLTPIPVTPATRGNWFRSLAEPWGWSRATRRRPQLCKRSVWDAVGAGGDLPAVEDLVTHRPFAHVDLLRTVTSSAVRRRCGSQQALRCGAAVRLRDRKPLRRCAPARRRH